MISLGYSTDIVTEGGIVFPQTALALEGFLRWLKAIRSMIIALAVSPEFCSRFLFPRFLKDLPYNLISPRFLPRGVPGFLFPVSVPDFCSHGVPGILFPISVPDFCPPISVSDFCSRFFLCCLGSLAGIMRSPL